MVKEADLEAFRESGLLWLINTSLHVFGWAIVIEYEEDKAVRMYPARVKYRGFDEKSNTTGYQKVSKYILENAQELLKESLE